MATNTPEEARDYILDKFKAAWDANAGQFNGGTVPDVEWPNVPISEDDKGHMSKGNKPWARVRVQHNSGEQRTLAEKPNRRFTRRGLVTVQVFAPAGKRGLVTGDRLGNVALDAFEGEETGDVWFRNAVLREVGVDGAWYQVNVVAEFEYDATK